MKSIIKGYKNCVAGRRISVDILVILFGIGTWVGINGMFVQLPLLVKTAPESWNLPSYMSVAVQIANFGPIIYALMRRFFPERLNDTYCIYFVQLIGVISAILITFFYDTVTYIDGDPYSTVFLILVFFTAIVGCTSSVLFFPYMRHYKEIYLFSYFIGEGLSGFIPSIVALIQGVGGNPECIVTILPNGTTTTEKIDKEPAFSIQYYFGFIAIVMFLGFCAFILMNTLQICKKEMVTLGSENVVHKYALDDINKADNSEDSIYLETNVGSKAQISVLRSTLLLNLMAVICAFSNGVFPSIQSYSCLPYGNTAYHLSVTLSSMANPVACFLAVFLPQTSNRWISVLSSICAAFVAYAVATSIMSPTPPLYDSVGGVVIVVLVWIIVVGLVSYLKLSISTVFRNVSGSWMFYCGCVSQAGSAIGSLVSFFLINYTTIFVPSDPCN